MQGLRLDLARVLVLDAAQQFAQDAETRGHDAAGASGVDALGQHVGAQGACQVAAQRGRAPELLVVAALGVEADDKVRRADAVLELFDVVGQVEAARLFAALDQHHAARMRNALFLQRSNRRQRTEHGITVVRAAAAVKLAVLDRRLPGIEILGPAAEFRLLVVVTVKEHHVVGITGDLGKQHWRAAFDAHDLHRHAFYGLGLAPCFELLHRLFHVAVLFPVGIEMWRFVRQPYVVAEFGNDRAVPKVVDEFFGFLVIHFSIPMSGRGSVFVSSAPS